MVLRDYFDATLGRLARALQEAADLLDEASVYAAKVDVPARADGFGQAATAAREAAQSAHPDSLIDFSDIPEMTDAQLATFRRIR